MPKPPKPKGYCYARLDDSSHVYRQQGSSSLESSCYRMLQSPATTFYATASWNGGPGTNLSSEHSANEEWGPSEPRQPALFSRPAVLGDLTLAGGRLHHVAPEALHVDASLAHRVVASPTQPYRPRYQPRPFSLLGRASGWLHRAPHLCSILVRKVIKGTPVSTYPRHIQTPPTAPRGWRGLPLVPCGRWLHPFDVRAELAALS